MAPTEGSAAAAGRIWLLRGLSALWLLDAWLQMQPGMFTMDMVSTVMQPTLTGQPGWLSALESWAIHWVAPAVGWWNWGFAGIQVLIAVLLWSGRPRAVRIGLAVSIGWGLLVWLFGEGLGGVLTGGASLVSGGPGSVVLYVWAAALLCWPPTAWEGGAVGRWVRDGPALVWAWGALQQMAPAYWTPMGLASLFQSAAAMQPKPLAALMAPVVALAGRDPVPFNAALVIGMAAVAIFAFGPRPRPWAHALAALLLLGFWVFGQGFGMVFTGMGTDPGTPPILALLMVPAWLWARSGSASGRFRASRPAVA
ncbi:MAG: hypothetical protein K6U14_09030 [Firmicutes bacterium]|nr:hypothetical protein [Alicyclobacillaceae bacterium]MCL6497754.1 hypothetical protein [Bacillota bacterium]